MGEHLKDETLGEARVSGSKALIPTCKSFHWQESSDNFDNNFETCLYIKLKIRNLFTFIKIN